MKRLAAVAAWLLIAVTVSAAPPHETLTGKVVGISDGDTISVLVETPTKHEVKVRLASIDAPESRQAFGQKAKQQASGLAFGKQVSVAVQDIDRYGRSVGVVTLPDGTQLNREMVKRGFAWEYLKYSKDPALRSLENEARAARLGLWADPKPQAPWEFRHQETTATVIQATTTTSTANAGPMVYATKSGKKYHSHGCKLLSKSTSIIQMTVADAVAKGMTPCGVCKP